MLALCGDVHQATFGNKESFKVELFLLIDPLVGLSTMIAGRFVNGATLWWTAAIMVACLLVPRGFCGYVCPLGTLIDGFHRPAAGDDRPDA